MPPADELCCAVGQNVTVHCTGFGKDRDLGLKVSVIRISIGAVWHAMRLGNICLSLRSFGAPRTQASSRLRSKLVWDKLSKVCMPSLCGYMLLGCYLLCAVAVGWDEGVASMVPLQ